MKKLFFILIYLPILFFGQESIRYTENKGQWDERCLYKADLNNGVAFFEEKSIRFNFYDADKMSELHTNISSSKSASINSYSYDLIFLHSNKSSRIVQEELFDGYFNYFLGSDKSKWKNNVKSYKSINYKSIYAGVDCRIYSQADYLKYDFIISPKSDVNVIKLKYSGVDVAIHNNSILIDLGFNKIYESEPIAFQIINDKKINVECNYILKNNIVSFEFPKGYNDNYELIIDPVLITATLSGSQASDTWGHSATYDDYGNIYTGARCFSSGYPTTTGAYQINYGGGFTDIALSKLDSSGSSLTWATYLGGSGDDYPHSLIVNSQNELCIYGSTTSNDYPTSLNAFDSTYNGSSDIIISHLNSLGTSLIGSSYFGGSSDDGFNIIVQNYGDEFRGEIMVDNYDNIFVASFSSSTDFPTSSGVYQQNLSGGQDGIILKANSDLSGLLWSTFIGSAGHDAAYGLRVDDDYVYFTGSASVGFPVTSGSAISSYQGDSYDGFVAKLNNIGTVLEASSFFGSSSTDQSFFIDLDKDSSIYIFGQNGTAISITSGCYGVANSSQFIAKFNNDLTNIEWQTSIGSGSSSIDFVPTAFLVDVCNKIYISGHGGLNTIPSLYTTSDALYNSGSFYLMQLSPNASSVDYATHFTGNHVDGGTSRFDPAGRVYQAVCSCPSISGAGMTTTSNAYSTTQSAPCDIGVFKLDFETSPALAIASANPAGGTASLTVSFINNSIGASFFWDFDDNGQTSTLINPIHTFVYPGTYNVQLISIDSASCNIADTIILPVVVTGSNYDFSPNITLMLDSSCNILTDLTITLAQDSGEVDIDSAIFISSLGSFTISTLNIGDTIGLANMTLSLANFSADLIIDAISSPSLIIVRAVDQLTTAVLGTFTLENIIGGGIRIIATSPNDGNNFTSGNNSIVTFNEVFQNPVATSGIIFNISCISEFGSVYSDSLFFPIVNCLELGVVFSNPTCFSSNNGFFNLSGVGGSGTYNYQLQIYDSLVSLWIPIGQTPLAGNYTSNLVSFLNLYSACYKIIIEDAAGESHDSIICLVAPDEIIAYELITNATQGYNNDGSIEIVNSIGGIFPFTYSWIGPNGYTSITQNIFNLESGIYSLTITDSNNCAQTFDYVIDLSIVGCTDLTANNYNPNAISDDGSCCYLNFYDDNIILCLGDSIDLIYSGSGFNVDNYLWSTGDTTASLVVSPSINSTYWLQQTSNGFFCYDTISVIVSCLSFSPSVAISLSDLNCSLTDLTINVSQDPNEVDMDSAIFTSNGGFFSISSMSIGDNIGNASMNIGTLLVNANLLVSNIISPSEIVVEAVNQFSGVILGTFTITNLVGGGVEIISLSPGDGNTFTLNGNSSTVTFVNVFNSTGTGFLNFTSNIVSELGDLDVQLFPFILNCVEFSPSVSVILSNTNCNSLTDLTINISQDPFEVDMDTAVFISDGGYFIISSLSLGDVVGSAIMSLNLNTFNTDLIVNSILSNSEIIVEAIDQLTGAVLGTFTITNLVGGGVEINAVSPNDGNSYTNGNNSTIIFSNIFHNPNSSSVIFTSNITSELGTLYQNISPFVLNCSMSPTVLISLSDSNCVLTDLTIVVSQDSNEVDMDTAIFISDAGSFILSSLTVGDNIGVANMILSFNTFNADLIVSSIVSSTEIIVQAVDQITGSILGTFTVTNLPGSGVRIIAISPDDGNSFTSGHISTITFNNIFLSPNTGFVNFTSEIISETGDVDIQTFLLILNCTDFSPTFTVSLSDLNCGVLADLTISISQDSNEVDMDTAFFTSNAGSFTISTMSVGDNIGTASMILALNSYNTNLIVNSIVSSSQIIVEAVDQITGVVIGTFTITNLIGGGVEIIAISPDDGNIFTSGNSSIITFTNIFTIPSSNLLSFTSNILSELGDIDIQTSSFTIPTISSYFTIFSCDSYLWNGSVFDSSGIYIDTMSNILGCDSIVTLTLTINYSSSSFDTVSVCYNYLWNGILYDSSGVYVDTILNNAGCDSIMLLNLSVNSNFSNNVITVCNSFLWNGVIYDSSGIYIDTLINAFLCDSIVSIDLTVDSSSFSIDSVIVCDSYLWNGETYDTSGFYYLGGRVNNYAMSFDGINDNVSLDQTPSFGPTATSDFTISIWVNPNISHSGMIVSQYENTIPNNSNYFLSTNSSNLFRISGNGTNYYDFGPVNIGTWQYVSLVFHSSGLVDTYINGIASGSSTLNLSNTVSSMPLEVGDFLSGGCTGCIGPFNGMLDNIDIWNTSLSQQEIQDNMLCSPVGNENNLVGYWNFEEGFGTTAYDLTSNLNDGIINGAIYNSDAPNQSCSLNSVNGCDSISALFLTVNYTLSVLDTIIACDSLFWNGSNYFISGVYSDTLTSFTGCDSIVTIDLTILNSSSSSNVITACDSYTWNGITYSSSGIYDTMLVNIAGCDSFTEIYLTIIPSVYYALFIHSCGNYNWNGNILNSTGIYIDTLISSTSCDSIVTLDLLITDKIKIIPTIFDVSCYGDSTGQINLNINAGSPPFIFQWSNGAVTEEVFNLLGDATYSCSIIDSAGCTLDTNLFISQPSILNVNENINNISCYGGNDGSIVLNISGGVEPYITDWGTIDTFNLVTGYYNYLVSDSNGCFVYDSVEVTQENPILIEILSENIQCFGQPTGSIDINVLPGSGVPGYSYEWIGPNLFSSTFADINNLFAGNYFLTIIDANLCQLDTIISLTQPINIAQNTIIQTSDFNGFNIRCKGDNSGWVSVLVSGGYEPYSYSWSNLSTSDSIYDLIAGTYILEVTDSLGCVIIFDFPLIEPSEVLSSTILPTTDYNGYNISCFGFNDGAILGLANGGVPDYTYYWNSILSIDSISDLFVGDYELTVYDKNNCVSSSSIIIIEPDSLFLVVDQYTDTCFKGVGRAEVNVFGGVAGYSYLWSNGSLLPIISNFSEGTYQVIVNDANLCQVEGSATILNLPSPIIDFKIYPNNQRLFDQFDDPLIFIDYTDGIWQDIISWNWDYDDGTYGIDSISYHSYSETGNYRVILTTISEHNCIDTLSKLAIITDYNLFIPNAFTPFSSDDELNNIFKPYGTGIISYKMEIFSRWGEMIFFSDNLDFGWDGTSRKGNQVPVGIYIYVIEAENVYGETFKYNGQVKLIR